MKALIRSLRSSVDVDVAAENVPSPEESTDASSSFASPRIPQSVALDVESPQEPADESKSSPDSHSLPSNPLRCEHDL